MENVLFTPVRIGNLTIKNRFVMPAMKTRLTESNEYKERGIMYYTERAKGGFGLIITEFLAVDPGGMGSEAEPKIWDDSSIDSFSELTARIHEAGGKIFAQLHHAGMISVINQYNTIPKGPSHTSEYGREIQELTADEIRVLISKFADAAERAVKSGFDGIEIHGAHGYLLSEFLNKRLNNRIDEYGGNPENRFRIISEIITEIRLRIGQDFPVTLRINSSDGDLPDDGTADDAAVYAMLAEKAGFNAIHVSIADPIRSYYEQPGFNALNVRRVKNAVSVPVIAVGRINTGALAERIIREGSADLVALGRESAADPHFPNKVLAGRETSIIHCAGCMQRCNPQIGCEDGDEGMSCIFNPFTGKEALWKIRPAGSNKKLAVIGSGCAGLEAAWILAKRGYNVSVYEKNSLPGGLLRYAGLPAGKEAFRQIIQTYMEFGKKYGVKYYFDTLVDETNIHDIDADAFIISTGSVPIIPPIKGLEGCSVTAEQVLSGSVPLTGKRIAVLGGGLVGLETAEWLHSHGNEVSVIEMKDSIASEMVKDVRRAMMKRIENNAKMHLIPNTKVLEISRTGELLAEQNGTQVNLGIFDCYVMAFGYRSRPVPDAFKEKEWHVIGDAEKASDAKHDIYFAAKFALNYEGEKYGFIR